MNIKIKKVIAREFLILISGISLGIICFVIVASYNSSTWDKWYNINGITIKKQKLADSLKIVQNTWQPPIKDEYDIPVLPKGFTAINNTHKDLRQLEFEREKKKVDLANQIKNLNGELATLHLQLINIESKTLYENNSVGLSWIIKFLAIIIVTLFFGLRYLYYAVRSSIETLKQ